jgi:hypothetical protein
MAFVMAAIPPISRSPDKVTATFRKFRFLSFGRFSFGLSLVAFFGGIESPFGFWPGNCRSNNQSYNQKAEANHAR